MPSARRAVIVTADDFGLSLPVNEAVERAHREGILSTASLMVAESFCADAVDRARRNPGLHVGLHVALVNARALLPPERIPLLAGPGGQLPTAMARAGVRYFCTPGIRAQLEAEIRAQFEAFRATGLRLDHVNAQSHMHVHPTVFGLLLRVGRDYGSPPVRIPHEPGAPWWLAPWFALMRRRAHAAGVATNDRVYGFRDTGRMDRSRVLEIVRRLPPGVSELYFHPATAHWPGMDPVLAGYALEDEFAALIDPAVRAALDAAGVEATTFAALGAGG